MQRIRTHFFQISNFRRNRAVQEIVRHVEHLLNTEGGGGGANIILEKFTPVKKKKNRAYNLPMSSRSPISVGSCPVMRLLLIVIVSTRNETVRIQYHIREERESNYSELT